MRITKAMCYRQIDMLNTTLHGDADTYTMTEGRWRSIPERYVIDHAYGGYKLCRYCNEGGGEYEITNYRLTARELYYVLNGINTVLRLDSHKPLLNSLVNAQEINYARH